MENQNILQRNLSNRQPFFHFVPLLLFRSGRTRSIRLSQFHVFSDIIWQRIPDIPFLANYGETNISSFFQDHLTTDCRKWQALFYNRRFSETQLVNPNFVMLANSYGIPGEDVETLDQLDAAVERMLAHDGAYLLNVNIDPEELVYPMTPAGAPITTILLNKNEKYEC